MSQKGWGVDSADCLSNLIGWVNIVGSLIPKSTSRHARRNGLSLSREMSERLYELSRVLDAVTRINHIDQNAIRRFLHKPHALLDG